MTKKLFCSLMITFTTLLFSQNTWLPLGPDDFNQPSYGIADYTKITHDNTDVPYIAFSDEMVGNKITVRKFVNNKWENVGQPGFSNSTATFISIDFDSNNAPYVSYKDTNIIVKKYNGTDWEIVGDTQSKTDNNFDIKIGNNIPFIAFQNSLNSNKASVKKFNGTNWEQVGADGISLGSANNISLAINNLNIPYIGYSDASVVNKGSVQKFNGTSWDYVGNKGFTLGEATYTSLNFDFNNQLYFLYRDGANSNKATMQKFTNGIWANLGSAGFTDSETRELNFTFDTNNNPFVICYTSNERTCVYKFVNNIWSKNSTVNNLNLTTSYKSISIDSNNNIFICFSFSGSYYEPESKVCTVKRLFNNEWEFVGDEPFSKNKILLSTLKDNNNNVYALLGDDLTVMKNSQGTWAQLGDNIGTARYSAASLGIDNNNQIYVAYSSDTNGGILLVKKFINNTWTQLPAVNSKTTLNASIDINSDNEPIVAYTEVGNPNFVVFVKKFNGTQWVTYSTNDILSVSSNSNFLLKIDKNITPNTLYILPSIGLFRLTNPTSNWESIGGGGISFDIYNNLVYSLAKNSTNNSFILKKYNGTTWDSQGDLISTNNSTEGFVKINNNIPYVTYTKDNKVSIVRYVNNDWNFVGNTNINAGKGNYPSLVFSDNIIVSLYCGDKGSFSKYFDLNKLKLNENIINKNVTIYPNPTKGKFNIYSKDTITDMKLYDLTGKTIPFLKLNSEFDITNLTEGVYFLKLQLPNSVKTIKLIKK